MSKAKLLISFTIFSMLASIHCDGQNTSLDHKIAEIDSIMYAHQGDKAIPVIDSLLKKNLPVQTEQLLKAYKVEALVQINKLESALNLSNEILENSTLKGTSLIRIYIERALIYELIGEIKESHRALDFVRDYYMNPKIVKDELYGEYLYRSSSLYRAGGLNNKGLEYAEKAIEFGRENDYNNVEATGLLLLGVMKPSTINEAIILRKKTMDLWKKNSNYIHISSLSYAIARYYYDLKKINLSKKYLDSSFYYAKKTGNSQNDFMLSEGHQLKGNLLEKEGNLKKAINHYKLSQGHITKHYSSQLEQQVSEANAKFNYEKEAIKNEALEQNLANEQEQKNNLVIGLIVLIVLLGVLIFLARNLTKSRKEIKSKNADLTDALDQNKLLLRELNHRVNNNLALILSLVKFQYYEIDEPKYKDKFQSLEHRIKTIAAAHEQLLYSKENVEGEDYEVQEYLAKITNALVEISTKNVQLNLDTRNINLNIDTMLPIGILINELMSNSLKHAAFKDVLIIDILITLQQSNITIAYKDSGTSFKETKNTKSLGVSIINSMVKQLRGTIHRNNSEYTITLQLKNSKKE